MAGSQDFASDPRNRNALLYLNGALVPRAEAKVSIFDAGFVLGDGVWEGIRLHKGGLLFLDAHIDRLFDGLNAIEIDLGMSKAELVGELKRLLATNEMEHGVHIRLMVTRGEKKAVNQDPWNALGKPTVVMTAEYKTPSDEISRNGLSIFTSTFRCTPPDMFDMRLNSHSRLGLIQALIQARRAGADEALMLDPSGFISSCNATNFFFVHRGTVFTSSGRYCFNGVTRANVIALCRRHSIPLEIGDFTLAEAYAAEEAFVTGTFGGLTPVRTIDGRTLPADRPGPMTQRLRQAYEALKDEDAAREAGQ